MTGPVPEHPASRQPDAEPSAPGRSAPEQAAPTVLEQIGGVSGLVYSTVPVVVFVPVNSFFDLRTAIYGGRRRS